jgi:hypothetical protein
MSKRHNIIDSLDDKVITELTAYLITFTNFLNLNDKRQEDSEIRRSIHRDQTKTRYGGCKLNGIHTRLQDSSSIRNP